MAEGRERSLQVYPDVPARHSSGVGKIPCFTSCHYLALTGCFAFVLISAMDTATQLERVAAKAGGMATMTKAFSRGASNDVKRFTAVLAQDSGLFDLQKVTKQAKVEVKTFEAQIDEAMRQSGETPTEAQETFQASVEALLAKVKPVSGHLDLAIEKAEAAEAAVSPAYLAKTHTVATSIAEFLVGLEPMARLLQLPWMPWNGARHRGPADVPLAIHKAVAAAPGLDSMLSSVAQIMPGLASHLEDIKLKVETIMKEVSDKSIGSGELFGVPLADMQSALSKELSMMVAALQASLDAPEIAIDSAAAQMQISSRMALDALTALEEAADGVLTQSADEQLVELAQTFRTGAYVLSAVAAVMMTYSYGYAYYLEQTWEENQRSVWFGNKVEADGCCWSCFSSCGVGCCFWFNVFLLDLLNLAVFGFSLLASASNWMVYAMAGGCSPGGLLSDDEHCTSTLKSLQAAFADQGMPGPHDDRLLTATTCAESNILICKEVSADLQPYALLVALVGVLLAFNLPRRLIWVRGTVTADLAFAKVMNNFDLERQNLLVKEREPKALGFLSCTRCVAPN